jgi:D-inositol-3-phosphate glycosyltransferase
VVATDVGGLRHTVQEHYSGLLVRGHDERAWADALAAILDDHDEMIRMGANAAAHAATFSWDNTTAATLQAYRTALLAPAR